MQFPESISKVQKELNKNSENFATIVGNPPYSDYSEVDGELTSVYSDFYFENKQLNPQYLSMIFPATWQKILENKRGSANDSLNTSIRDDASVVSVNNFTTNHRNNSNISNQDYIEKVSVVLSKRDHDSDTVEFSENNKPLGQRNLNEVKCWGPKTDEIFLKLEAWRVEAELKSIVSRLSPPNVYLPTASFLKDSQKDRFVKFNKTPGWIRCWGLLLDGDYGWGWIEQSHSKLARESRSFESNLFKVFFRVDCGAYAIWRKSHILGPGEIFTPDFIAFYFNTKNQASNFQNFMKTNFYRFLSSETGSTTVTGSLTQRFVPDLSTVLNPRTGKTGWDSDWIDSDLKNILKDVLSVRDWDHISDRVLLSDGYREEDF